MFHGFTGNINEKINITIAETLAKEGIASVRFDFNGTDTGKAMVTSKK